MNGSVERKRLHVFNLIGFEAIRITIWPKRTKIALFLGKSSATLALLPMLQPPKFGHAQRAKFCFPFLMFHFFSVFFGGKRFCKNSESPEIISEKVRLGGRNTFLFGIFFDFTWFLRFSLVCLTILCSFWHVFPCTS